MRNLHLGSSLVKVRACVCLTPNLVRTRVSVPLLSISNQAAMLQPVINKHKQKNMPTIRLSPTNAVEATYSSLSSLSADEDVPLPSVDEHYLSDTKFAEFSISPQSKRALAEVLKYERCSIVQEAAIPVCLNAVDVIAKAKTGTGKTLAFIIPAIEKVLANRAPPGKVSVLVLSPTRELARQIQTEAHKMLTFHPKMHSMVVYGGVEVKKHLRAIKQQIPDILVATPGRCLDIMTQQHDPTLTSILNSVRVLVLDEADNLLDMGFRPQLSKILNQLPPTDKRQTLLFSATFPSDVKSLADVALKRQHSYVDAVGQDLATHSHVEANSLVVTVEGGQLPLQLLGLMARHMAEEPEYKIIVFLPTANLTAYFANLFTASGVPGVIEIHSRKSQPQRDNASAKFRSGSQLILFSSDVSARGVDYPGVTYVIQLGAPASREQYIHRAGRTGRAGRAGQATLMLADFEVAFLSRLKDLSVTALALPTAASVVAAVAKAPVLPAALTRDPVACLGRAKDQVDESLRSKAYQSFLGFYKSHAVLKLTSQQLVMIANQYAAKVMGCPTPPGLLARTVAKMGLKGVAGLVIIKGDGQQQLGGQQRQMHTQPRQLGADAGSGGDRGGWDRPPQQEWQGQGEGQEQLKRKAVAEPQEEYSGRRWGQGGGGTQLAGAGGARSARGAYGGKHRFSSAGQERSRY